MNSDMLLLWGLMATFTLSLTAAGYLVLRPRRTAMERLRKLPVDGRRPVASGNGNVAAIGAGDDIKRG